MNGGVKIELCGATAKANGWGNAVAVVCGDVFVAGLAKFVGLGDRNHQPGFCYLREAPERKPIADDEHALEYTARPIHNTTPWRKALCMGRNVVVLAFQQPARRPGLCRSVHRSASWQLSGMQALESTPRNRRLTSLSVHPKYQTMKARLPTPNFSRRAFFSCARLANKECQRNHVQSDHGKKSNACQCEHLRHGSPPYTPHTEARLLGRLFFIGRGIEPEMAGTGCKPRLARARRHKHKVSIDPIWTQATWAQRPVIDAIVLHASDRGTGPRLSCFGDRTRKGGEPRRFQWTAWSLLGRPRKLPH